VSESYGWGEAFQKKLLAILVREPDKAIGIIEPQFFTNPIFTDVARISKNVLSRHERGEVKLTRSSLAAIVRDRLEGKRRRLWPLYKKVVRRIFKDKLEDMPLVLGQALEFAKDRKFRENLVLAEKDISNRRFDAAIRRFEEMKTFGKDPDVGIEYWSHIGASRWKESRQNLIRTFYFRKLDRLMEGGAAGGELVIILAGGKVGKSMLLGRIAAGALWQAKNVAIASGELSAKKYRKRIDAMITGIKAYRLLKYKRQAKIRLRQAMKQMKGKLWIKQFPSGKASIGDVESWLDQLKDKGVQIDMLVLDYLYLFQPNEKFENRRLNIGQAAVELRGLAVSRNIPVWTASQGNRAALSKATLGPQDLAEDISQFWTLDFLLALCQTADEENSKPQRARLSLIAARDVGRGGTVKLTVDRERSLIKEAERGE